VGGGVSSIIRLDRNFSDAGAIIHIL
jgi:hypothetical protein